MDCKSINIINLIYGPPSIYSDSLSGPFKIPNLLRGTPYPAALERTIFRDEFEGEEFVLGREGS